MEKNTESAENAVIRNGLNDYMDWVATQQGPAAFYEPDMNESIHFSIEGIVVMHELLKVRRGPVGTRMMLDIQHYLYTLLRLSIQRAPEEGEKVYEDKKVTLDASIIIGEDTYSSKETGAFLYAVFEELPRAKSFTIDCTLNGCVREAFDGEPDEDGEPGPSVLRRDAAWTGAGMLDMLERYKRVSGFEYKMNIFYTDSGEYRCAKILNGKDIDLDAGMTEDVVSLEPEGGWEVDTTEIIAAFDYEKHPDIVEKLHGLVRDTFEGYEVTNCEGLWGEDDYPGCVCSNNWYCKSLQEVQDYLDKVNEVLRPIMDEVSNQSYGCWVAPKAFGCACCVWTDEGFRIKGLMY